MGVYIPVRSLEQDMAWMERARTAVLNTMSSSFLEERRGMRGGRDEAEGQRE